jgi:hypothetical protein
MTAVEVLHTLQARDIQLTADGNQLRYDAPESSLTAEVLTLLRQHKATLLTLLQLPPGASPLPEAGNHADHIPLLSLASRPGTCYACGTTRRWRSVYGAMVCGICHPPADAALVAAWEGEA